MKYQEDQFYIERVRDGDLASFSFLVNRYKDMVFTIARKIVRNVEDAEDVAQESFVKAYQQLHQFEGKSKFSTWLYTIVYRTSVSRHQKTGISMLALDEPASGYAESDAFTQLEEMQVSEQRQFIREAIDALAEPDGLLITLYYMNENSIREIEEITGLSASNIKVRLFRARKILEDKLRFLL